MSERDLSVTELMKLSGVNSADPLSSFLSYQLPRWQLLKKNLAALTHIKQKRIELSGDSLTVQFNPERVRSTAAKIKKIPEHTENCVLCEANLPEEQLGLAITKNYRILCNPYPIFNKHFTVAANEHQPQALAGHLAELFDLSILCPKDYLIFFNGALAGASALHHLHFQICRKQVFPLINYLNDKQRFTEQSTKDGVMLSLVKYLGFDFIHLKSANKESISDRLELLLEKNLSLSTDKLLTNSDNINLLVWRSGDSFEAILIAREKHRPGCFGDAESDFMISPATVELCGVVVLVRETDFNKVNESILDQVFTEVLAPRDKLLALLA